MLSDNMNIKNMKENIGDKSASQIDKSQSNINNNNKEAFDVDSDNLYSSKND